jgi:hypothetical protein
MLLNAGQCVTNTSRYEDEYLSDSGRISELDFWVAGEKKWGEVLQEVAGQWLQQHRGREGVWRIVIEGLCTGSNILHSIQCCVVILAMKRADWHIVQQLHKTYCLIFLEQQSVLQNVVLNCLRKIAIFPLLRWRQYLLLYNKQRIIYGI